MTLQQDMDSKRNWTQAEIDGLKSKYSRTHFTHFRMTRGLRPQRRKVIGGVPHVWMFGAWRIPTETQKRADTPEVSK